MGLKEFYYGLEDKYYSMLDWLDKRGIPVYKVVDAIESSNVPSFPLFILLCILIVGLLWFFAIAPLIQPSAEITVFLTAGGERISGEKVIISFEGLAEPLTKTSTENGEVKVSVPVGKEFTVKLETSENYTARTKNFTVERAGQEFEFPLSAIERTLSRVIMILDSQGRIFETPISIRFSCSANSSFNKTASSSSEGKILLEGIPKDCGYLQYELPQGFSSNTASLDPNNQSPEIRLSAVETRIGKALVSVKDSEGNPLAGKKVQLLAATATENFQSQFVFSNATGTALFENIPIGMYRAQAVDETGDYFAEPTAAKEVKLNETSDFEIKMQKTSVGSVKLLVVDASTGIGIQNAKVELYKGTTIYGSAKTTDSAGRVEFKVAENLSFTASIDHPSYLKANGIPASISAGEIKVLLTQANSQNSNLLVVKVIDEKGSPVELTKVKLLKASDASAVEEKTTGVNGIVVFERMIEGSYIVKALKPGFGEAVKTASVVSRQENIAILTLAIGSGTINLAVTDKDANPIPNASVEVFDNSTNEKIAETNAESDGKKSITARADKTVYLHVSAEGFAGLYTIPIQMAKDITVEKTAVLLDDAPSLGIEPVGGTALFLGSEKLLDSLSPGQKYTARFLLRIPEGTEYTEAGIHLRTGLPEIAGESETTQVEADPLYIKNIVAGGNAIVLKGKTYSPPNNYAGDIQNLTRSEAKWANIIIPKAKAGVYEVEAEIVTRDSSQVGKNIELRYRAWGKSTGYVRYPADPELGSSENTGNKQSLYATTKNIPFSIGPGSLCSADFCNFFKITDTQSGETTAVIDEYSAKISSSYRLSFSSTFIGSSAKQNTVLKIYNADSALEFENYSIKSQGSASGSSLEIPIGLLSGNDSVSGWLDFHTAKEGATKLIIELFSGNEKLQSKEILLDIQPAKNLNVEVIPKMIVPYISNNLLVKASEIPEGSTDSNSAKPVSGAVVNFMIDNTTIASVETNNQGIAAYTLSPPPNNSKLVIEVKKQGYNTFRKEITINESILMFMPSEVIDELIVNGVSEKQRTISIVNASPIALTIKKIEFPKMEGLVTFALDSDPQQSYEDANGKIGNAIERDANTEFLFKMKLTEKGKSIPEPKTIKATIDFVLENPNYSTWIARLPIIITAGFGEEVDSADCLSITPGEWKIIGENDEKALEFTLKNNCKISESPAELQDLQAKIILLNQSEIGKFRIASSSLPGSKETELSAQFRGIAPLIPKNSENQIVIAFAPLPLEAGYSKPKIVFKAVNKTKNGNQEIESEVKTEISINDLSKCVRIEATNTVIQTTPYGTGFAQYGNYYGAGSAQGAGFSPFNNWGASTMPPYIVPNTYGTAGVLPTTGPGTANPPYIVPNTNPSNPALPTTGAASLPLTDANPYGSYASSQSLYDSSNPYSPYSYGNSGSAFTSPYMNPGYQQYFPDSSYRSPYLDPYTQNYNYGTGSTPYYDYFQSQYGASPYGMMSWQQSSAVVRIENNCAQSIEIASEASPALQIQQGNFVLKPRERKNINVEAGYRVGRYPAVFLGRVQASQDGFKELKSFLFTVQSATDLARDCIGLDRTKFRFNEFLPRPVIGRVFNSCWDTGVRLLETSDAITLTEMSESIQERIGGTQSPNLSGAVRILGITTDRGSSESTGSLGTGSRQILEFEIERDYRYREFPAIQQSTQPFQQVGALRQYLDRAQNRVQSRGTLTVRFLDMMQTPQAKPFQITLEDIWQNTQPNQPGQPSPAQMAAANAVINCVNPQALQATLDDAWFGDGDAKKGYSINSKTFTAKILETSKQGCENSSVSNISLDKSSFGAGNEVKLSASPKAGNADLAFDRSGMKDNQEIIASGNLTVSVNGIEMPVNQALPPSGPLPPVTSPCTGGPCPFVEAINSMSQTATQRNSINAGMKIPFSFTIKKGIAESPPDSNHVPGPGGTATGSTPAEMEKYCSATLKGKTGAEAVPKIKLDWKFENIAQYACDITAGTDGKTANPAFYCDSTQFTIEAVKKAIAIKPLVDKAKESGVYKEDYTIPQDEQKNYQNSAEIYRHLIKQQSLTDYAAIAEKQKLAFFLADDVGTVLNRKLTDTEKEKIKTNMATGNELDAILKILLADVTADAAKNTSRVSDAQKVLDAIAKDETLSTSIIAEIDVAKWGGDLASNESNADRKAFNELGASYHNAKATHKSADGSKDLPNIDKVYLTFNEFKRLHEELKKALENKEKTDTTKMESGKCTSDSTTCWIKEIDVLANLFNSDKTPTDGLVGKTQISTAFLRNFANNSTFKIGVRNQKAIPQAERDLVLSNAARIDGAEALTKDFYYKNIDFNALLVKDTLDSVFAEKFHGVYNGNYSGIPTVDKWAFSKKTKEGASTTDDGNYHVIIKQYWTETPKAEVELTKQGELPSKSAFYKVGFDGKVKSDGTDLLTAINSEVKITKGHFATVKEFPASGVLYSSTDFTEDFKFKGKILELSETAITYLPTSKVSVTATTQSSGTKKGMEYRLRENQTELTQGKLITWMPDKETTNLLCTYTSGQSLPYARSLAEAGTFKANMYLPQGINLTKFDMQLVCAAGTAKIEANGESISASSLTPSSQGANLIILSEQKTQGSIAELLEKIASKNVCIVESSDNSKAEIYWN